MVTPDSSFSIHIALICKNPTTTRSCHMPMRMPSQTLSYRCASQPCSQSSLHEYAQPLKVKPVQVASPTCMPAAFWHLCSTCAHHRAPMTTRSMQVEACCHPAEGFHWRQQLTGRTSCLVAQSTLHCAAADAGLCMTLDFARAWDALRHTPAGRVKPPHRSLTTGVRSSDVILHADLRCTCRDVGRQEILMAAKLSLWGPSQGVRSRRISSKWGAPGTSPVLQ